MSERRAKRTSGLEGAGPLTNFGRAAAVAITEASGVIAPSAISVPSPLSKRQGLCRGGSPPGLATSARRTDTGGAHRTSRSGRRPEYKPTASNVAGGPPQTEDPEAYRITEEQRPSAARGRKKNTRAFLAAEGLTLG